MSSYKLHSVLYKDISWQEEKNKKKQIWPEPQFTLTYIQPHPTTAVIAWNTSTDKPIQP